MTDEHDQNNTDDFDGMHFDDAELEAALEGFEQEFRGKDEHHDDSGSADQPVPDATDAAKSVDDDLGHEESVTEAAENALQFEEDLEGILGNHAKIAMIITRITSGELLSAFCELADISATCLDSNLGAVAILHNLDGDGPEAAAADLTRVVAGLGVVLAVNRADKLEATLYLGGNPGQTFAPPILFSSTESFVEDLMLGIATVDDIVASDRKAYESGDLNTDSAYSILAKYLNNDNNMGRAQ